MKRYDCLVELASRLKDELLVLPVGMTGDEFEAIKPRDSNFRCQCMGAATTIGMGLALALPKRKVMVLEADGGVLMNLGALTTLANVAPRNMAVIVFDNASYESVGSLPTATSGLADLCSIARGAGIRYSETVSNLESFKERISHVLENSMLTYTVAKVDRGSVKTIRRGSMDGVERMYRFVRHIEQSENKSILSPPAQKRRWAQPGDKHIP